MKTLTANKVSLSASDNKRYTCSDGLSTLQFGHYSLQSYVESNGDSDSLSWFDPNQSGSQINLDFSGENLSELFKESQVDWDFESNALLPPAKRMRKHCSERLNQLLDNASNYSPPDLRLINASNIKDEDIPDDQIVDFYRASSSEEEQSVCSLIDYEASESSGEQ